MDLQIDLLWPRKLKVCDLVTQGSFPWLFTSFRMAAKPDLPKNTDSLIIFEKQIWIENLISEKIMVNNNPFRRSPSEAVCKKRVLIFLFITSFLGAKD